MTLPALAQKRSPLVKLEWQVEKRGDSLLVYSLSGNMIDSVSFDSAGQASVTLYSGNSYVLKFNVGGENVLETIVSSSDIDTATMSIVMNGATTWATQKVMSLNPEEESLASIMSSQTGLSSLENLSLSSASSSLTSNNLEEAKLFTLGFWYGHQIY